MRRLLMALLVTCLLTSPSFGVLNVKFAADKTGLSSGESTTIRIWAQGTNAGVFSLGGYITATGDQDVLTSVGAMHFDALYSPSGLFTPKAYPDNDNHGIHKKHQGPLRRGPWCALDTPCTLEFGPSLPSGTIRRNRCGLPFF